MNSNNIPNWSQFQCLHPLVVQALTRNQLARPTNIQQEVFQHYPHYFDFLVAAQTGSGKTLAFAAPILSQLQQLKEHLALPRLPQCILGLVLTPTRELAQQIDNNIRFALSEINSGKEPIDQIKVACIIGGISKEKQLRILKQTKPQIIIGTPGRLHQLLDEKVLDFSKLKYLVIDEADRMVQMGHFRQIDEILQNIFEPKQKEFFQKDFEQINKNLDEKAKESSSQFFLKQGGKKIKVNFDINSLPTEQLFEVPASLFQFAEPQLNQKVVQTKSKKKQKRDKILNTNCQLTSEDEVFIAKLKRRIFFISATLTRQFKGTKYFIKKARTEEEWKKKKQDQKLKRKQKEKQIYKTDKSKKIAQEQPQKDQTIQQSIPKLKALLSRAKFSDKPKIIDQSSLLFLPEGLTQLVCFTQTDSERISLVINYLKNLPPGSKTIVFGNTIKACKRIQFFIDSFGFQAANIHSRMQQKQRLKRLQKFKKSTLCNILIATDVAARGLDFNITHVIQVGVPVNGDTYVHRAGRTARANRKGQALVLVDKRQANRWSEINDIISSTSPNRKVNKYQPTQMQLQEIQQKFEKFDWIRRNQEKQVGQSRYLDEMDAQDLGVGLEDEAPRKKYDMDREEEDIVRHQVKMRSENIRTDSRKITTENNPQQQWRKNKLVLSLDEIRKLL